jgi:2-aminoadipate transaminase
MFKMINWMGAWPREGLVSESDWGERLASVAERYPLSGRFSQQSREELVTVLTEKLLNEKTQGKQERLRIARSADAALNMLATKALKPGDAVLVERPTSRAALQIFRKAGARLASVDSDEQGMVPDSLSMAIMQYRPRLVYAAPICTDPEGKIWSRGRIDQITEICRNSGVLLLRDDRQEMLVYEPFWHKQCDRRPVTEGVLSVGQLPPGLIAGFRLGWIAGTAIELERWLPETTTGSDDGWANSPLECQALTELIRDQPLPDLIDMLRVQFWTRMRQITGLLERNRAPGMTWRNPEGGIHLWVTLPVGLDGETLLRGAWLKGLMFQPGTAFYASDPVRHTLRLTFAGTDEQAIKLGTARLKEAIGEFLARFDYG